MGLDEDHGMQKKETHKLICRKHALIRFYLCHPRLIFANFRPAL
jgi:hypothetical protein